MHTSCKLEASLKVKLGHSQRDHRRFSIKNVLSTLMSETAGTQVSTAKKATPSQYSGHDKKNNLSTYTFITYCIQGGRSFKSRPSTGTRPQQM